MATPHELGRLEEVDVREVWRHEAQDFTPWLASHLDRLGEAIGLPLELRDTEVAVDSFAADILARDTASGANVLIENQLTKTDHGHLGQILGSGPIKRHGRCVICAKYQRPFARREYLKVFPRAKGR